MADPQPQSLSSEKPSGSSKADEPSLRQQFRAAYKPVSSQDLEARFQEWARARSDQPEEVKIRRQQRLLTGGLVVVLAAAAVGVGLGLDHLNTQISDEQAQTQQLRTQIDDLPTDPEADTSLQDRITEVAMQADERGRALASAQNRFSVLERAADQATPTNDGTPTAADEAVAAHREDLAGLISEDDYLVTDQDPYQWTTGTLFDPVAELDPRWPWFVRYDGDDVAAADSWAWQLDSVTPQLDVQPDPGTLGSADVVFTARDADTDEVLAFAEAVYTADDETVGDETSAGVFSDIQVTTTVAGSEVDAPAADASQADTDALRPDGSSDTNTEESR